VNKFVIWPVFTIASWSAVAIACPPPPPPPLVTAPPLMPDEDETAYFDRLANAVGHISYRPPLAGGAARAISPAEFEAGMRAAYERYFTRQTEQRRAAQLEQERRHWDEAAQILLVEPRGYFPIGGRNGSEWEVRLNIISRVRGNVRQRSIALRVPPTTSCGPYYPSFSGAERYLIFAPAGPLSMDTLLGVHDRSSAQDQRTRDWLDGQQPRGR
jgi:hypothetical protein